MVLVKTKRKRKKFNRLELNNFIHIQNVLYILFIQLLLFLVVPGEQIIFQSEWGDKRATLFTIMTTLGMSKPDHFLKISTDDDPDDKPETQQERL